MIEIIPPPIKIENGMPYFYNPDPLVFNLNKSMNLADLSPDKKENIRLKILLTMAGCVCYSDIRNLKNCPLHNNPEAMKGLDSLKTQIEEVVSNRKEQ